MVKPHKINCLPKLPITFVLIIASLFTIRSPVFSENKITGTPLIAKRETVYLIDTSASMGMDDPQKGFRNIFPQVRAWILGHIEGISLNAGEAVTIITFDADVSKPFKRIIHTDEDKEVIRNKINSLQATGKYTYTTKAVLKTLEFLERESKVRLAAGNKAFVYLLTDGQLRPPCRPYITWAEVKAKYEGLEKIDGLDFLWILVPLDPQVTSPPGLEDKMPAKSVIRVTPNFIDLGEITSREASVKIGFEFLNQVSGIESAKITITPHFADLPCTPIISPGIISAPQGKFEKDLILTLPPDLKAGTYEGKLCLNSDEEELILFPAYIEARLSIPGFSITPQTTDFGRLKRGDSKTVRFSLEGQGICSSKTFAVQGSSIGEHKISFDLIPDEILLTPQKPQKEFSITLKALKNIPWLKKYPVQIICKTEGYPPLTVTGFVRGTFPWITLLWFAFVLALVLVIIIICKKFLSVIHHTPLCGEAVKLTFNDMDFIRIGRKRKGLLGANEVHLYHDSVSLIHAEIRRENDKYIIKRIEGSLYVNERRIEEAELTERDRVEIGDFNFEFILENGLPVFLVRKAPEKEV